MQLPSLSISTTDAQIGMRSYRPPVSISQRSADMTIQTENILDTIRVSRTASQLFIDQTEAFADADVKSPLRRATEFAQGTTQKLYEYMAKKRQEGDQLMKIEHGTGQIARIAMERGKLFDFHFDYKQIPKGMDRVNIHFAPSELTYDVRPVQQSISVQKNDPDIEIKKWQTDVYLRQKESINIDVIGLNVNKGL